MKTYKRFVKLSRFSDAKMHLRQQAEELIRRKAVILPETNAEMTPEQLQRTLHELRVHQIELGIQNEELQRVNTTLDAVRQQYEHLYDYAPTGYLSIDKDGIITEANLTVARKLGVARSELLGAAFSSFVCIYDQEIYYLHKMKLLECGEEQHCKLRLRKRDNSLIWVMLVASVFRAPFCAPVSRMIISDITEFVNLEQQKDGYLSLVNATLESTADGILVVDTLGKVQLLNRNFLEMWHIPQTLAEHGNDEDLLAYVHNQLIAPDEFLAKVRDLYMHPESTSIDTIYLTDNRVFTRYSQPQRQGGKIVGRVWSFLDETARWQSDCKLIKSEVRFREMFEHNSAVMLLINPRTGRIVDANAAAHQYYGWTSEEIKSMTIYQINILPIESINDIMQNNVCVMRRNFETSHRLSDDQIRDVEVFASLIEFDGEGLLFAIVHDITERKLNESRIKWLTFHDVLTGLYNRTYFESELSILDVEQHLPISIIFSDINNLKLINDVHGHERGDEFIVAAAALLQANCRSEDIAVRYGGDEFIMLLLRCDEATAEVVVKRMREFCCDPAINKKGAILFVGHATKYHVDEQIAAVIRLAENRMYEDKRRYAQNI